MLPKALLTKLNARVCMQPRSLCNISVISTISVAAIFDGGLSRSQDAFCLSTLFKSDSFTLLSPQLSSLISRFKTVRVYHSEKVRLERERHSNWRVGEIFLFKGREVVRSSKRVGEIFRTMRHSPIGCFFRLQNDFSLRRGSRLLPN